VSHKEQGLTDERDVVVTSDGSVGDGRRLDPGHEEVAPMGMDAPSFLALALGDEAKLGVREGREGYLELAQEPRAQQALDLKAQWALAARQPAFAFDPELPVGVAVAPRLVLDPRRGPHTLKEKAWEGAVRGRGDLKHRSSICIHGTKVICSHDE
jgi:hypothetical protein